MSLLSIKIALETRLAAMSGVLETEWENVEFTPTDYPNQKVSFLPAAPENPTMGDAFRRERGIMQVTLRYPLSGGGGTALAMAEQIKSWFPRGQSLVAGGVTVTIERTPEIGPARPVEDRYQVPISIRYFANISA